MKIIRHNIFETNSSSTHSIVIRPINMDIAIDPNDIRRTLTACAADTSNPNVVEVSDAFGSILFCKGKKMLVLDRDPGFEFGVYATFYEKLNYIVCLLLHKHGNELYTHRQMWDDTSFNISKANRILNKYHKDFCDKIAQYVSMRYKIDCTSIGYLLRSGKGGRKGNFHFDHEVLNSADDDNFSLREPVFKVITTEGLAIKYEFA